MSVGGAAYFSGQRVNNRVTGSLAFAAFAHEVAKQYPNITVALHTDHCAKQYLDEWVNPLLDIEIDEVKHGASRCSSRICGTVPRCRSRRIWTSPRSCSRSPDSPTPCSRFEIGAVGGEEDGHSAEINEKLYSSVADGMAVADRLGLGERGKYMAAFTFGNVHGAYKPGVVKLRPELLHEIQQGVWNAAKSGELNAVAQFRHARRQAVRTRVPRRLRLHCQEIAEAVSYGVIKMNIDTDTQYAFTRAVAGHMFRDYDGVLKIDGEVGNKKQYDPRSWGREAEDSMAARVVEACEELGSAGRALK